MSTSSLIATAADDNTLVNSELYEELLVELDDRAAIDDEQLWINEEQQKQQEQQAEEEAEPDAERETEDTNQSNSDNLTASASDDLFIPRRRFGSTRPFSSEFQSSSSLPLLAARATAKSIQLAASINPLTREQQAIASELDVLDISATTTGVAAIIIPDRIRTSCKYSIIHPLIIKAGKERTVVMQRAKAEEIVKAAKAAEQARQNALNGIVPVVSTSPVIAAEPEPSSATSGGGFSPSNRATNSASRSGSRGGKDNIDKRSSTNNLPPVLDAAPLPPPVRTFAHVSSVASARSASTQQLLQHQYRIPLSKVSAVPLMPDNEHWHVIIERSQPNSNMIAYDLSIDVHSIRVVQYLPVVNSAATVGQSVLGDSVVRTSYSFNGCLYREVFHEGGPGSTPIDVKPKFDAKLAEQVLEWLSRTLLLPLALPASRAGWILFWDEYLNYNSCTVHMQLLRTILDHELIPVFTKPVTKPSSAQASARSIQ